MPDNLLESNPPASRADLVQAIRAHLMDIKGIVAKALNGHAFIDPDNSGAKDLDVFQEIVKLALVAEAQGLLETVFVHPMQKPGKYDLLYITGATEGGRAFLGEP